MKATQLRPTFFSIAGNHRVYSGFKTRLVPGVEQFDIWAYPMTLMDIVEHMGGMAPFTLDDIEMMPVNKLGVVVVPHASLALKRGESVEFIADVDLTPLVYIERGERGIICRIDRLTGERWIWLSMQHTSLNDDQGTVSMVPHHDGELIAALRTYLDQYSTSGVYPQEDIA